MLDLTIVTVSYNSTPYLNLNRKFTTPVTDWIVIKNRPEDDISPIDFIVIDGEPRPVDQYDGFVGTASFHHALGLNKACQWLKQNKLSRYLLFLDPDFYIIPSLEDYISYIEKNNLTFFGAPYYIENKPRLQEFPVAFCMFVDTQQINIDELDFTPKSIANPEVVMDTGYNIYNKYKNNRLGIKYEATIPFSSKETEIAHTTSNLLKDYGIATQGKIDQYFWFNKLFGIHIHAKVHLKSKEEVALQTFVQTKNIRRIIKYVRAADNYEWSKSI